jgi:predicted peptidase
MKRKWILLLSGMWIITISSLYAQQYDYNVFYGREFRSEGDTLPYRIMYPEGYEKGGKTKYPLVIFLHGADERGSDNESQLKHGADLFKYEETKTKYPAIVIFPQCPEQDKWAEYERDSLTGELIMPEDPEQTMSSYMVQRLINYYIKNGNADPKRIYIMGLSMGGMGVLDLIVREPKMFAAAVSICGAIEPTRLKKLKKLPIRLYHGSADEVVPVSYSRDAFYQLKAEGSRVVEIIEYPGVGHDSWNWALGSSDYLEWIFSQKK